MTDQVKTMVKKIELDTSTPLDIETCLVAFNGPEIYYKLLPKFEDIGFLENLYFIAFWVQVGNFEKMMQKAHSIKGSAGYAGASRIWEDWYWIQVWFEKEEYVKMMKHYCSLIEHSAQFRIHWRKKYHLYLKTTYVEQPGHWEVPLPFGWKLERLSEEEFKVHYPEDYLELAIEAEATGKKYIKQSNGEILIQYKAIQEEEESENFNFISIGSDWSPPSAYKSFSKMNLPLDYNPYLASSDESDLENLKFIKESRNMEKSREEQSKTILFCIY